MTTVTLDSKVKVKINFNLILWLVKPTIFQCLMVKDVHICHNNCLWCVGYNENSVHRYDLEVKAKGRLYLKSGREKKFKAFNSMT